MLSSPFAARISSSGQELWHHAGVARDEEGLAGADQPARHDEVPQFDRVREGEHRDGGDRARSHHVGGDHHEAARQPVGEDARREHEQKEPDAVRGCGK